MIELPERLIFANDSQFEAFYTYEQERRAIAARTGGARPLGVRLSTPCPVRMVKSVFDPEGFSLPVDPGDAERGHEFESRWRAICLQGIDHEYQPSIDYGIGVSAWDVVVPDWDVPTIELKTTIGKLGSVHTDWRTTTERRMVAAGMQPGALVNVFAIHPGNLRNVGPLEVELSEDAHAKHAELLWGVQSALEALTKFETPETRKEWNDAAWWKQQHQIECVCGWCIPLKEWEANDAIERLISRYHLHALAIDELEADSGAVLGVKFTKKWSDDGLRARIIEAAQFQAVKQEVPDGEPVHIRAYGVDPEYDIKRNRKGVWSIKARPERAERVAAGAA